jgi:surface antigen
MLSLDRKRNGNGKKAASRSRRRFLPPLLESIPRSTPVEQLPFPMVNGNILQESMPQGTVCTGSSLHGSVSPALSSHSSSPMPPTPLIDPLFSGMLLQRTCETEEFLNPLRFAGPAQPRPCLKPQNTEQISVLVAGSVAPLCSAVVIHGSDKKPQESVHPPAGRRAIVGGAVCVLCAFVLLGTCLAVSSSDDSGPLSTLNALNQEGSVHAHGAAMDSGSVDHFLYGQCTYWANMRYHQLTGHWIPWLGNASQWAYEAPTYGWTISDTPNPHGVSIMVFGPYAESSGAYGHVAVVERVNADGSVYTSNWNWHGAWATLSYMTFYPTNGVHFIWFPD